MTGSYLDRKKNFYFKNEEPRLQLSYCVFVDVLGYTQRIRSAKNVSESQALLRDFYSVFSKNVATLQAIADDSYIFFKSFSDNILLAHPRTTPDMESEFEELLDAVCEFQFEMALVGLFVRGGFATGQLFMNESMIYGEALVSAHDIEANLAVYPIVVMCPATRILVEEHITFYSSRAEAPQAWLIAVTPEGNYFLNYLYKCLRESNDRLVLDHSRLSDHKNQLIKAIQTATNERVLAKYMWLGRYHNTFCESVSNIPGFEDDLRVPDLIFDRPVRLLVELPPSPHTT